MYLVPAQKNIRQWVQIFHPSMLHIALYCERLNQFKITYKKTELKSRLTKLYNIHHGYLSHLLRTKHQGDYYEYVLKNLKPGECVMITDYKMKLELGK